MRTGPITRDASTVQLGLSQIRIGRSLPYIANILPALLAADSIGALASTSFTSETEYFDLESGFPLALDATFPMRESNILECAFKEITPKNLAISRGMDPLVDIAATALKMYSKTTLGTEVAAKLTADADGSDSGMLLSLMLQSRKELRISPLSRFSSPVFLRSPANIRNRRSTR